jgi:hypothetical protein
VGIIYVEFSSVNVIVGDNFKFIQPCLKFSYQAEILLATLYKILKKFLFAKLDRSVLTAAK